MKLQIASSSSTTSTDSLPGNDRPPRVGAFSCASPERWEGMVKEVPGARFARAVDVTAALLDDAVDHGEAEAVPAPPPSW